MQEKKDGEDVFHRAEMRYCDEHDFEDRGVVVDEDFLSIIEQRLCPDIRQE